MKNWILGFFAATLAVPLQAAIITEQYNVALPTASGIYGAGHTFQIIATYDNTGTVMHTWNDGANGTADFGTADDTVDRTFNLTDYPGYTMFSDATITVTGLLSPVGATPYDALHQNYQLAQYYENPSDDGLKTLQLVADEIIVTLQIRGPAPGAGYPDGYTWLVMTQFFADATTQQGADVRTGAFFEGAVPPIARSSVPEPPVLALIGLGLAGFGQARRRNRQKSTV